MTWPADGSTYSSESSRGPSGEGGKPKNDTTLYMPVSLPPPFSRPIFGAHAVFPLGDRGLTPPSPLSSTSDAAKTLCGFCGQENDAAAQFCADCGKSLRALRSVP